MTRHAKERVLGAGRRNHHSSMKTTNFLSSLGLGLCFVFPVACVDRIVFPGEPGSGGATGGARSGEVEGSLGGTGAEVSSGGSGDGVPNSSCPEVLPTSGTMCEGSDVACAYTIPNVYCGHRTASCDAGSWQVIAPSCPPPSCPGVAPNAGETCDFVGHACSFGSCEANDAASFRCVAPGVWAAEPSGCECPADVPRHGDPCEGAASCQFAVPGTFCPDVRAWCMTGAWVVAANCTVPSCPEVLPAEGDACGYRSQTCPYGSCATSDAVVALCSESDTWQFVNEACP